MNVDKCANCILHGWQQVEDPTTLQQCKNCKVIKYCGKDCQTDHWKRVHKKHCRFFADPVKAQRWQHKEGDCNICQQSTAVGQSMLRRADKVDNPNYQCIFQEVRKIPPHFLHPHPFPATGEPGDVFEKGVIILWQLLKKFVLTHPKALISCREELEGWLAKFLGYRLSIWWDRKILGIPESQTFILDDYDSINTKLNSTDAVVDPFKLWKIILLVNGILVELHFLKKLHILVNPLAGLPAEFHTVVSMALNNSAKFLATVKCLFEALTFQVIPLEDLVRIICDGNLQKTCSICSTITIIGDTDLTCVDGPYVLFNCLYTEVYCCEKRSCREKVKTIEINTLPFYNAVGSAAQERGNLQCDCCFLLPPSGDVHRCSRCLTVMYCSKVCQNKDWPIHMITCKPKQGVEIRKKKSGSLGRRNKGKDDLEKMKKMMQELKTQEEFKGSEYYMDKACEDIDKFRFKDTQNVDDHTPT